MTPHLHPQTQGTLHPPVHPAPARPTRCLRGVYSSLSETREVTGLVFLGPFGLSGALRRGGGSADRRRLEESRPALRGPARGRSSPANLTGWLVPSPVRRSNSGSPTAQPRPRLSHFRRGVFALTRPGPPAPTTPTRTLSQPLPFPPLPHPPRLGHPGDGGDDLELRDSALRPAALLASELQRPLSPSHEAWRLHCFRLRPEGGRTGWREREWAGWRERDQGFRVTVACQRLLWA